MITLKDVKKNYSMGEISVQALNVNELSIKSGEFITILGPSGSGKTTLLNIIGGLDIPTSGNVNVFGMELSGLDERDLTAYRKEKVGFVFQFFNLIPTLTAFENIEIVSELVGYKKDSETLLARVGLADRKDHFPSQLSGGQQQRISIARAIVKDPALLLCDEPTGALDTVLGKQVLEILHDLSKKEGKTVIIVTHNEKIREISDRVITVKDGCIVSDEYNVHQKNVEEVYGSC